MGLNGQFSLIFDTLFCCGITWMLEWDVAWELNLETGTTLNTGLRIN